MMERQSATHDIDELQASMLRSLASAHRLRILHLIGAQPCEVHELARDLVDLAWLCADQVQDPKAMGAGQGPQHRGLELIDVVRCALAFHHAARASWFEQIRRGLGQYLLWVSR